MGCARRGEWLALNPEAAHRVNARMPAHCWHAAQVSLFQPARIALVVIFRVLCIRQFSARLTVT
jgi:hypothetical protein